MATYIKSQGIIILFISILSAITLGLAGIKSGPLWGILTGLLDALPLIGSGIVLIPLAITQLFYGLYGRAIACIVLYCCCALLREFLEPRLIGRRMGIPAISVLIAIYAGVKLFGIWGIIKGPLGFMIIYQSFLSFQRRNDGKPDK
jgi:predicted PurR-regulated permease PerM